ncbi:hypothetical protein EI94DRAFT_1704148 [Lactarius quietus]|nr:hypothetical protein EI94DRAFT_1704148 [Lactarius quietus]
MTLSSPLPAVALPTVSHPKMVVTQKHKKKATVLYESAASDAPPLTTVLILPFDFPVLALNLPALHLLVLDVPTLAFATLAFAFPTFALAPHLLWVGLSPIMGIRNTSTEKIKRPTMWCPAHVKSFGPASPQHPPTLRHDVHPRLQDIAQGLGPSSAGQQPGPNPTSFQASCSASKPSKERILSMWEASETWVVLTPYRRNPKIHQL